MRNESDLAGVQSVAKMLLMATVTKTAFSPMVVQHPFTNTGNTLSGGEQAVMIKDNKQKKRKGRSVQDLCGVKTYTKYGLATGKGELLFFLVTPTNISVLSSINIEIKVRHLMMVLSDLPDIEITCTDPSECFDDNKAYLQGRLAEEHNPKIRRLLKKDLAAGFQEAGRLVYFMKKIGN